MSTYSFQAIKERTRARIEELQNLIAAKKYDTYILKRNLEINMVLYRLYGGRYQKGVDANDNKVRTQGTASTNISD